jgi:hypothetical protein
VTQLKERIDMTNERAQTFNEEDLARPLTTARGAGQEGWIAQMNTPEGFRPSWRGKWASKNWQSFNNLRARLAHCGIRTEHLPLGPRGGRRWVLSPEPLDEFEVACWTHSAPGEEAILQAREAGLTTADEVHLAVQLHEAGVGNQRGVGWYANDAALATALDLMAGQVPDRSGPAGSVQPALGPDA